LEWGVVRELGIESGDMERIEGLGDDAKKLLGEEKTA
jgi:hypothetical protein